MTRMPLKSRWFAALAASATLIFSAHSMAGQITLQGVTGNSCTYSGITVDAGGSMTATCPPPSSGPAGTFNITSNGIALPWNFTSNNTFTITRSSCSTGGVTVGFTRSGGCGPLPLQDVATFANGVTSVNVPVRTPNNSTTCKFTLTFVTASDNTATSAPVLGSSTVATVPVSLATVAGCPAASSAVAVQVNPFGVDRFTMASGTIAYMALPTLADLSTYLGAGAKSAKFQFADATNSPSVGTKEVWISHCPGVFDSSVDTSLADANPGRCYISDSLSGDATTLNWFAAPGTDPSATDALANAVGICEAYSTNGPWFVNFRWTYQDASCPWGVGACGYTGQWNVSGYAP